MKYIFLSLLILVACKKTIEQTSKPNKSIPVGQIVSIEGTFVGESTNDVRLQNVILNFSSITLNTPVPVSEQLGCSNYEYGSNNMASDQGIPEGTVLITSTDGGKTGVIKFGHLPYVEPSEVGLGYSQMSLRHTLCDLFSKESFNFEVSLSGTLTIYAIAPGKPWDGSMNSFSSGAAPASARIKESFTGSPTNDPRLAGVVLDLSAIVLNEPVDIIAALGCGGFEYGSSNAGVDLGKPEGSISVISDDGGQTGKIIFGHLPYIHPSEVGMSIGAMTMKNELCYLFSKEAFNFTVLPSGTLELRAIAPGKPWDNALSTFSNL